MIDRIKLLFKDEFYRNIVTLASGTVLAQIIPILISPVLTRLYSPEDFGVLALFLSITTVAAIGVTGRYELSILLPKENRNGLNLTVLSIILCVSISFLSLVLLFFFEEQVNQITGNRLGDWLYLLPVSIFLLGLNQSLNYWINRNKKFKTIAASKVTKNVANSLFSLSFGFLKFGYAGLILSLFIGQFTSVITLLLPSYKTGKVFFEDVKKERIKKLAYRYRDFPKINLVSALLNSLSIELPIMLLTFYFNPVIVGFYALSQKVLQAPMGLVGSSVGQVYFQKASEESGDLQSLKRRTLALYQQLIKLGTLPISVIFFFAPDLFSFVFGEEWRGAGEYAQVLSIWILFVFISSPLSNLLTVLEKHKQNVFFNAGLLLSRIVSIVVGALYFQSEYLTIVLYGAVGAIVWMGFIYYLLSLVEIGVMEVTKTTMLLIFKWSLPVFCLWLLIQFFYAN